MRAAGVQCGLDGRMGLFRSLFRIFVQWDGGGWERRSAVAVLVPAEAVRPVLVMTRCARVRAVVIAKERHWGPRLGVTCLSWM